MCKPDGNDMVYRSTHFFQHARRRPTATVPVTIQQQALIRDSQVFVISHSLGYLGIVTLSVVGVGRCHMGQYLRSIDTTPVEGRMREGVDVVPGQLTVSLLPLGSDLPFA